MPGYEIKEWNETNFDVSANRYVREAYNAGKYAFVSDYARYRIVHDAGGVYLDTDVELIRSLQPVLDCGAYMGFELPYAIGMAPSDLWVNSGLGFAAPEGMPLLADLLERYESRTFIRPDGTFDLTTVVGFTTDVLCEYGLESVPGIQHVAGFNIYPQTYFNPMQGTARRITTTPQTISIHHADASWESKSVRFRKKIREILGPDFMEFINRIRGVR